jgi:hypothetical protein
MSIRLDPRRVNALKHLAGEAGVRPGDLVRQWVEERIDAQRAGAAPAARETAGGGLAEELAALVARVEALEARGTRTVKPSAEAVSDEPAADTTPTEAAQPQAAAPKRRSKRVSASPGERVALHDEMIAVLAERGPLSAADLAAAVAERGRYAPPRSGKPIDAAMVSQRVSNPTYRARFTRNEGRIGLAETPES